MESYSYTYYNFGTAQSTCLHFVLLIWQRVALYEHNKKFHLIFNYFCSAAYFCFKKYP